MIIDTRVNLIDEKFVQKSGSTLNFSGTTNIYGNLEFKSLSSFILADGSEGNGYILNSDSSGKGSWIPNIALTGATNGLTAIGKDVKLGGTLSEVTTISGGSQILNLGTTASPLTNLHIVSPLLFVKDPSEYSYIDFSHPEAAGADKYFDLYLESPDTGGWVEFQPKVEVGTNCYSDIYLGGGTDGYAELRLTDRSGATSTYVNYGVDVRVNNGVSSICYDKEVRLNNASRFYCECICIGTNDGIGYEATISDKTHRFEIDESTVLSICSGGTARYNGTPTLTNNSDLVHKSYVDGLLSGGITGGTNGLTISGDDLKLGGTLIENTTIDGAYTLSFTGGSSLNIDSALKCENITVLEFGKDIKIGPYALNDTSSVGADNNIAIGSYTLYCNSFGAYNIAVGRQSLSGNTIGSHNIGVGLGALQNNSSGLHNIAQGCKALFSNDSGCYNVGIGGNSLYSNTSGDLNVGVGYNVLFSNTTGCDNVAIGHRTLYSNQTGCYNIGMGRLALNGNLIGKCAIAIGYQASYTSTAGNNIAIGHKALCANVNGTNNVAIGNQAYYLGNTGFFNIAIGDGALSKNTSGSNVGIGFNALQNNVSGSQNISLGFHSMHSNTGGTRNIAIGQYAMTANINGLYNVAVGVYSFASGIGSCNVVIGNEALYSATNVSGNVAIGRSAGYYETGSNKLHIGNNQYCSLIYGEFDNKIVCVDNKLITNELQINSGATNGYVLTSDASGNATWQAGGSGSLNVSGDTVNGLTTYVDSSTICSQSGLTFNGTCLVATGCVCATSAMYATNFVLTSDERLKTNVIPISIAPIDIEYKEFEFKSEPNRTRYGVIAQDLQSINPELVTVNDEGMLSVSYIDMLVKEIAYLKCEIKEMKSTICSIKNSI